MAKNRDDQNQSFEAQQVAEGVAQGTEKTANVDVEADYEAAKKLSTTGADQEDEAGGSKAPGSPDEFRNMAQQVNPAKKKQ
jgi:hypothetical protein